MDKSKSEMADNQHGYTDDMWALQADLRRYTRFIATLVRLELVQLRVGQVLSSNYGMKRFEQLRNEGFRGSNI